MTEYILDNFGIWKLAKREKGALEELGFFNSYAGIENIKRLVVRTDKFEKETVDLVFSRQIQLLENGNKSFFKYKLKQIDKKVKMIKDIYRNIRDHESYDDILCKPVTSRQIISFSKKIGANDTDGNRALRILEHKKEIVDELMAKHRKSESKTIEVEHCTDLKEYNGSKHYSTDEVDYIIQSFGRIPLKDIALINNI